MRAGGRHAFDRLHVDVLDHLGEQLAERTQGVNGDRQHAGIGPEPESGSPFTPLVRSAAVRRGGREHRHEPVEGVSATGAHWTAAMRYGALPQTLSNFVSYTAAALRGQCARCHGDGLRRCRRPSHGSRRGDPQVYYSDVSAILLQIVITVSVIDTLTGVVRHRLIGLEERR